MSHGISTLLLRNLADVFGENDPVRRRAAIDELCTEDCVQLSNFMCANSERYVGKLPPTVES